MSEMMSSLVFTESAALKVYELIQEEGNPKLSLRVFITGGGCSGFKYGFTFDENINEDDMVIVKTLEKVEKEDEDGDRGNGSINVNLLVDPLSYQYLAGAKIDYREDVEGARFVIQNPNAQTTCGCGSSFSA
jgi:iron-sulfur cluster insertion protein